MHSDLGEVVQSISLSLQVSQFQLQGFQAAGTQRAAEQLQEQRAGHHACQLVQQPLASWIEVEGESFIISKIMFAYFLQRDTGLYLSVSDWYLICMFRKIIKIFFQK